MTNSIPRTLRCILLCTFAILTLCNPAEAKTPWQKQHPRLLFSKSEEKDIKRLIKQDNGAAELALFLKHRADSIINLPQIPYGLDKYGAILHTSRAYVDRLGVMALAYRMYGDEKYLKAAEHAMIWVCNFKDWNPAHYLDTAEMTTAVAIAYDWLYDDLDAATRNLVKSTIYRNAITRVLNEYEKGGSNSWAKRETNWNVVCNTGMVLGALALAEDYPEEALTILEKAAEYMPNCLKHFGPDGVCYEGPAYWGYTNSYLALYLKAVMDNGGDKAGIGRMAGLEQTGLYYKRTLSPTGRVFNFANSSEGTLNTSAFFLFSKLYDQPELAEWYCGNIHKAVKSGCGLHTVFFLSLPWYDNRKTDGSAGLPALEVYRNIYNDIIVLNGKRDVEGSLFVTAKGGEPKQAHQQLDCGTFILESEGVRWTDDLGADDYALKGFWDYRQGGLRWNYFRNTNFSHNTFSIDGKLQHADGRAFVCDMDTDSAQPHATLDMSSLYKEQAESAFRKFILADDRTMDIEDSFELKDSDSKASWSIITKTNVETDGDKAHLTSNGKHLYMQILSPAGASFVTSEAKTCTPEEKPISNTTILSAECSFGQPSGKIIVRISSRPIQTER